MNIDLALITILPEEYQAALAILDPGHVICGRGR